MDAEGQVLKKNTRAVREENRIPIRVTSARQFGKDDYFRGSNAERTLDIPRHIGQ
jgi:hypothetical protein